MRVTKPELQHELKKKRPFELPEQEAALNILRTSDRLQAPHRKLLSHLSASELKGLIWLLEKVREPWTESET